MGQILCFDCFDVYESSFRSLHTLGELLMYCALQAQSLDVIFFFPFILHEMTLFQIVIYVFKSILFCPSSVGYCLELHVASIFYQLSCTISLGVDFANLCYLTL